MDTQLHLFLDPRNNPKIDLAFQEYFRIIQMWRGSFWILDNSGRNTEESARA
jgi:hypothetical protein